MQTMRALSMPMLAAIALLTLPAQEAAAHRAAHSFDTYAGIGRSHVHPVHYGRWEGDHRREIPRRFRRDRAFMHWYRLNAYRYSPDTSWRRLYRRFERDHRFHRWYGYGYERRGGRRHHERRQRRYSDDD